MKKYKLLKIRGNKTLVSNFGYLSILQIVTLLLPLLSYPYLIRILGSELYGKIIMAQAICSYFSMIINYGFNISATKNISIYRENSDMISEIFSSILIIKIILFFISFSFLVFMIHVIPFFKNDRILYILTFFSCFNELLFQQFYFQGVEKMKYITILNSIPKTLFFTLIFLLIKTPCDYLLIPVLNGIGALIGGLVALYVIIYRESIVIARQPATKLFFYFKESSPFFLSRILSTIIHKTNTILLGCFVGYNEVSFYDLAQKIQMVLLIPFDMLNQVIFPHIARSKDMHFMKKILCFVLFSSTLFSVVLLFTKEYLIFFVAGREMLNASFIVSMMGFGIIFVSTNYFLGNTILVVMGLGRYFNRSISYTATLYIFLIYFAFSAKYISIYSLALIIILSDIFCVGYRYYYINKFKILQFNAS